MSLDQCKTLDNSGGTFHNFYTASAKNLDLIRLRKQIVEASQIYDIVSGLITIADKLGWEPFPQFPICLQDIIETIIIPYRYGNEQKLYKEYGKDIILQLINMYSDVVSKYIIRQYEWTVNTKKRYLNYDKRFILLLMVNIAGLTRIKYLYV